VIASESWVETLAPLERSLLSSGVLVSTVLSEEDEVEQEAGLCPLQHRSCTTVIHVLEQYFDTAFVAPDIPAALGLGSYLFKRNSSRYQ
jgi:hypothetical protein